MATELVLHLNLKGEYFDQIARGEKTLEYRLCTPYWTKRLAGREFSRIRLMRGYPAATDSSRVIDIPWAGYSRTTITHRHFGPNPVEVFAIAVRAA